ncbi:hypothetical protein ZIOFF_073343 [Zingiber officinale]|uniref:Uncharacterized protein n=1 Tax=Zingiber officinale TaxID=94328 RepID=A0A8J5BBX2_ZINOF|nr:hypothetical protein ZIOFF_073343 [Zingiber officinale]
MAEPEEERSWRQHEYMRTKWFSAFHRTTVVEEAEAKDNSAEEATTAAIETPAVAEADTMSLLQRLIPYLNEFVTSMSEK